MPPKIQKSKAAKMLAAQSSAKSKGKKKKWAKAKLRDKKQHSVVFNKVSFDKFIQEVPKKSVITIYSLIEAYKINGALARKGIQELLKRNLISPVLSSGTMRIYTKSAAAVEAAKAKKAAADAKTAAGGDKADKSKKPATKAPSAKQLKKEAKAEAEADAVVVAEE